MNRALVYDPVNAIVPKCDAKIRTRDCCGVEFLVLLKPKHDWHDPTVKLLLKSEVNPERRLLLF